MHELAVTERVLEISLRHAEAAHATRITQIHLVVGQLSSIVDDSVQFYWDLDRRGDHRRGRAPDFRTNSGHAALYGV